MTLMTLSDLALERIALGELDAAALGVRADDPRIAALRADDAATRARYLRDVVVARVLERIASSTEARRPLLLVGPAFAMAAVALLVVIGRGDHRGGDHRGGAGVPPAMEAPADAPDVTIAKGIAPTLTIHVADGDGTTTPLVGAARAGDRLQLTIVPAGRAHAVVVSIDGRGDVTLHAPDDVAAPTAMSGAVALPHSFELDDAPAFERFVLVTSQAPIDVASVLEAARVVARGGDARSAPLVVPAGGAEQGIEQWSRVVEKVAP